MHSGQLYADLFLYLVFVVERTAHRTLCSRFEFPKIVGLFASVLREQTRPA
jgi:hypothetical protein